MLKTFTKHGIKINDLRIPSRSSYKIIPQIIELLVANNIKMYLNIVDLFPHMLNDFTSKDNVYKSSDTIISDILEKIVLLGKRFGITVTTPKPFDHLDKRCSVFWEKIQVWPVAGIPQERYHENLIPHACMPSYVEI